MIRSSEGQEGQQNQWGQKTSTRKGLLKLQSDRHDLENQEISSRTSGVRRLPQEKGLRKEQSDHHDQENQEISSRTSGARRLPQEKGLRKEQGDHCDQENQEISRPARSRTPSLKDLEILRFTMAWMDLRELHRLHQHQ
ncbi:putative cadherin-1-like protein [Labeo rohita]|uniref:Putative cadherin-1-like protein n=1 Tax=Labeo rohita TaxID=84645 RepID=A0A498NG36_LABRO|nr:putative cadherin-1-like protein [Labeo rohita]